MNSITNLLDLEDPDVIISDVQIQGRVKTINVETPLVPRFCPTCGYRMHSRGVKKEPSAIQFSRTVTRCSSS
ncbi:MAG: hypothetical protein IKQ25_06865 [Lachnospiraceae bacterium]|nr:hypothetical protein [Lachnospiraceae bacterium]